MVFGWFFGGFVDGFWIVFWWFFVDVLWGHISCFMLLEIHLRMISKLIVLLFHMPRFFHGPPSCWSMDGNKPPAFLHLGVWQSSYKGHLMDHGWVCKVVDVCSETWLQRWFPMKWLQKWSEWIFRVRSSDGWKKWKGRCKSQHIDWTSPCPTMAPRPLLAFTPSFSKVSAYFAKTSWHHKGGGSPLFTDHDKWFQKLCTRCLKTFENNLKTQPNHELHFKKTYN